VHLCYDNSTLTITAVIFIPNIGKTVYCHMAMLVTSKAGLMPFKDEAQTALFKDPVRTAL
jgi:hypothetical protein